MWNYPQSKTEQTMDSVEAVAAELAKHEAICAERWKTIFNKKNYRWWTTRYQY